MRVCAHLFVGWEEVIFKVEDSDPLATAGFIWYNIPRPGFAFIRLRLGPDTGTLSASASFIWIGCCPGEQLPSRRETDPLSCCPVVVAQQLCAILQSRHFAAQLALFRLQLFSALSTCRRTQPPLTLL